MTTTMAAMKPRSWPAVVRELAMGLVAETSVP